MAAAKESKAATPTRAQRALIGVVVFGAVTIAGIGFAGSYAAVRELAVKKGFGNFSYVFPIGIDAGICVLLALDLLLTWIRIPFPLLRQTAWLLTAATIAFNGASAWPDPLGVGMHAVIPILFVVAVEAARHAIGRMADITADKHMEGVRLTRWLLSPIPTFLLWRRMKLWELRSYDQVIKLEQERLVYQARLRSRFGRAWRKKAPVESLMPLRLARYGVPLQETASAGLAASGLEPLPLLHAETHATVERPELAELTPAAAEVEKPSVDTASPREMEPDAGQPASEDLAAQAEQLAALDLRLAYDYFVTYYGERPDARTFAEFLATAYQIADPATGGPVAEALLLPILAQLDQAEPSGQRGSALPAPALAADVQNQWAGHDHAIETFQRAPVAPPSPQNDAALESPQDWNAAPSTAQRQELEDSNPAFQGSPAEVAGTPADRTGGSNRLHVQMRIPAQPDGLAPDATSGPERVDEEDALTDEATERDGENRDETPEGLKGIDLVQWHYQRLPDEMRKLSANKLAPQLAELMPGYTVGSVRKYIGDLRRAAKESARA
ncbi:MULTISPECIES: DUF2637 domain-containing protein [unclassified Streptomyces]|uniref:DUF2637 domain-containing protein n=1 Tax=unclassified Streptomyces TaxID=2593676 RepID=UPI002365096A|nr:MULTISPECIES: DUF2637 domain-containing protein [unclassified Streptomyces]MDF3141486.1 DUF2637 domain-containing protein [Streptomyces sp. T21Q-yed]WDF45033.1 DUF2637 domain-containing protein [Streptomyces sp. T12]